MISKVHQKFAASENIAYWISMVFLVLMCLFFIIDKAAVLVEYKFYSVTTTGILGIISVFCFGLYVSKKGRPDAATSGHIIFSLWYSIITVVLYLISFTIANIMFA